MIDAQRATRRGDFDSRQTETTHLHAYHGEFGIYSKYQLEAQTVELQAKYDAIKARRVDLERRVQLMHEGTLEKDMLDEQARRALNLSQADEITIMLPTNSK